MLSPVIEAVARETGDQFSVKSIDVAKLGRRASPIALLDNFRVSGRPFGPHPHAGFSQLTYVFPDSKGAVNSRDSLGNNLVVGPGGIVWTQAGSGMMHQEVPADPAHELHGLQVFVNLSSKSKFIAPKVLHLMPENVPTWRGEFGDTVRVAVGTFAGVSSSLVPAEPFDFLEVELRRRIFLDLADGRNALIYALEGSVIIRGDYWKREIPVDHAMATSGIGERLIVEALRSSRLLILSGLNIREPMLAEGPFIMNSRSELDAAVARFHAGEMGRLAPLPDLNEQRTLAV